MKNEEIKNDEVNQTPTLNQQNLNIQPDNAAKKQVEKLMETLVLEQGTGKRPSGG